MRSYKSFTLAVIGALVLSGCAHGDQDFTTGLSMALKDFKQDFTALFDASAQTTTNITLPYDAPDSSYIASARTTPNLAGGQIRLYGLDESVPAPDHDLARARQVHEQPVFATAPMSAPTFMPAPLEPAPVYAQAPVMMPAPAMGIQSMRDSSVTVFSMDQSYDIGVGAGGGYSAPAPLDRAPLNAPMGYAAQQQGYAAGTYSPGYSSGGVARVYFGHGSKAVTGEGQRVVGAVADAYRLSGGGAGLKVEGHASSRIHKGISEIEKRMINLKVSMDRALNVSRELIRAGVPATAIETAAYGDTRPTHAGKPGQDAESASRRVEITPQSAPAYRY